MVVYGHDKAGGRGPSGSYGGEEGMGKEEMKEMFWFLVFSGRDG